MAIHHLACVQKRVLYERVHRWIGGGGHFLVLDAVLGAGEAVEEWYVELWEHWIHALQDEVRRSAVSDIPRRYKTNLDNKPDTLLAQLRALEQLGFMDVDCYYKYGIFAMFGGRKAP